MVCFDNFEERTLNFNKWIAKASELEQAAEVLAEKEISIMNKYSVVDGIFFDNRISLMPQTIMLYAFAIENYLKGLLALRKMITINNGQTKGLSHELADIIKNIGINIDEDMEKILDKYTRHILWEGRYPAPIRSKDLPLTYDSRNLNEWPNTYVIQNDIDISRNIISQIKLILQHQIKHFDIQPEL
jgi:hypothetical protein